MLHEFPESKKSIKTEQFLKTREPHYRAILHLQAKSTIPVLFKVKSVFFIHLYF